MLINLSQNKILSVPYIWVVLLIGAIFSPLLSLLNIVLIGFSLFVLYIAIFPHLICKTADGIEFRYLLRFRNRQLSTRNTVLRISQHGTSRSVSQHLELINKEGRLVATLNQSLSYRSAMRAARRFKNQFGIAFENPAEMELKRASSKKLMLTVLVPIMLVSLIGVGATVYSVMQPPEIRFNLVPQGQAMVDGEQVPLKLLYDAFWAVQKLSPGEHVIAYRQNDQQQWEKVTVTFGEHTSMKIWVDFEKQKAFLYNQTISTEQSLPMPE